jgi:hypothetical protein
LKSTAAFFMDYGRWLLVVGNPDWLIAKPVFGAEVTSVPAASARVASGVAGSLIFAPGIRELKAVLHFGVGYSRKARK